MTDVVQNLPSVVMCAYDVRGLSGRSLPARRPRMPPVDAPSCCAPAKRAPLEARLLAMERQSRHRYFRLAAPSVGQAVEALMAVSPPRPRVTTSAGPLDGLRLARTCYDHLAGRLGVSVTDAMVRRQLLKPSGRDFLLTASGARFLGRLGVDVEKARKERRAFARQCLDWDERRAHLAGALGAAVARRCLDLRWARGCRGLGPLLVLVFLELFGNALAPLRAPADL